METTSTEQLDRLLTDMINSTEGISDLLFVAGKAPQYGSSWTAHFIHRRTCADQRADRGSGPHHHQRQSPPGQGSRRHWFMRLQLRAREHRPFPRQHLPAERQSRDGLRRLQARIPSMESRCSSPPVFKEIIKEKTGLDLCHRRHGQRQDHHAGGDVERN